jgi:hypothetical protein
MIVAPDVHPEEPTPSAEVLSKLVESHRHARAALREQVGRHDGADDGVVGS